MEEKLMKNEEIRDINDKNISKHQFIAFFQFIFRIGFREEKRTTKRGKASKKRKDKERKGQARKIVSNSFNRKTCK